MQVVVVILICVMIVNVVFVIYCYWCVGSLLCVYVWLLGVYIGVGVVFGVVLVGLVSGDFICLVFVVYFVIIIFDCLLCCGFFSCVEECQVWLLGVGEMCLGGMLIGVIVIFFGVGGSVMIVLLLCCCGLSMIQVIFMVNLLSLLVVFGGIFIYLVLVGYQE